MIPFTASVRIHWWTHAPAGWRQRHVSLWIPLFLAWLLLLPLILILFPVVALACLFVHVNVLRLYATAWGILSSLRHTFVEVRSPAAWVRVRVT